MSSSADRGTGGGPTGLTAWFLGGMLAARPPDFALSQGVWRALFTVTARTVLLACAGVIGAAVIVDKTIVRLPTFLTLLHGESLPPLSGHVDTALVIREGIWVALALIALACVVAADGPRSVGLTAPLRQCGRVLGGYAVIVPVVVVCAAIAATLAKLAGHESWFGNGGLDPSQMRGYWIYKGVATGIVEEVLVVAVAFRLLELVPARSDGRRFVDTGWAMAVFIGLRVSYHCYYGLGVIAIAVMAWLVMRLYRTNRALLPLIVAHALYDIFGDSNLGRSVFIVVGAPLLLLCAPHDLTLPMRVFTTFGFRNRRASAPAQAPAPADA